MTEYRYIIQAKDQSCRYLSAEGIQNKPKSFLQELRKDGFTQDHEQHMGEYLLRVFKRQMYTDKGAGAIVRTNPSTGQKSLG